MGTLPLAAPHPPRAPIRSSAEPKALVMHRALGVLGRQGILGVLGIVWILGIIGRPRILRVLGVLRVILLYRVVRFPPHPLS